MQPNMQPNRQAIVHRFWLPVFGSQSASVLGDVRQQLCNRMCNQEPAVRISREFYRLEDNYRLYHVVNGSRRQFAGSNFKVTPRGWHELRVEAVGNKITCYYEGDKKIEATDDTFKDAGKVGLWTKADSVTYFDDLMVTAK
jgi:hypothetical protein